VLAESSGLTHDDDDDDDDDSGGDGDGDDTALVFVVHHSCFRGTV
jgi:hypothetical protein